MDRFFQPQSIVLFGASHNQSKGGWQVMRNLQSYMKAQNNPHFYIIHPKATEIAGVKCYKSFDQFPADTPSRIDLAVLVVPVEAVYEVLKDCIAHNVRGILIESGNISNDDAEVTRLTKEIKELIKGKDIRIVGPNSIGFNNPALGYCTPIKFYTKFPQHRARNVSICAQSGLFVTGFIEWFFDGINIGQPFGIGKVAAIGNKIDVNECDILEYYLKDPQTNIIGMYLEDIRQGQRFLSLVRQNASAPSDRHKPIILLKSGRSTQGAKAIQSHTGSLAGNHEVIKALSQQFGLYLVESYEDLFAILSLLYQYPHITVKGKGIGATTRIGVISISGSGCVLSADFAEKYQLQLPELTPPMSAELRKIFPLWAPIHNPIDTWASIEVVGPQKSFNEILRIFLESNQYDAVIMISIASSFSSIDLEYVKSMQARYPSIPIALHFLGGDLFDEHRRLATKHEIPVVQRLEDFYRFLRMMVNANRNPDRLNK